MAEVNTGSSEGGFVFGQNMEDRAIKPPPEAQDGNGVDDTKEENGTDVERSSGPSPLRPSAFRPGGGVLAPSRLAANPFVPRPAGANHAITEVMPLNSNPFAAKACTPTSLSAANSDSEDEKKEKPIVAPTHFCAQQVSALAPHIVVTQDRQDSEPANRFILKPSALDRQTANFNKNITSTSCSNNYKTSFKLEPAKLQSPLASGQAKDANDVLITKRSDQKENTTNQQSQQPTVEREETKQRLFGDASPPATSGKENLLSTKAEEGKTENSEAKSTQSSTKETKSGNFVFGENMEKRVTNAAGASPPVGSSSGYVFGEKVSDGEVAAGATSPDRGDGERQPATEQVSPSQTLAESAAAHQAKRMRPELQQVEVKTGEENESNVFQINAKLFAFDIASQSWLERGRGLLRLNDMSFNNEKGFKSRLVMRTTGSLRVVLNTKVWAGMMVERASQKSVRVTAAEGEDSVKVFLIMANPKDADQIFSAIDWRVQQLKMAEPKDQPPPVTQREFPQVQDTKVSQESVVSTTQSEKRQQPDTTEEGAAPIKKPRIEPDQRRDVTTEESNDSSTLDPETEASNESFSSTTKSSSSSE